LFTATLQNLDDLSEMIPEKRSFSAIDSFVMLWRCGSKLSVAAAAVVISATIRIDDFDGRIVYALQMARLAQQMKNDQIRCAPGNPPTNTSCAHSARGEKRRFLLFQLLSSKNARYST
jgi:hypothetical protein